MLLIAVVGRPAPARRRLRMRRTVATAPTAAQGGSRRLVEGLLETCQSLWHDQVVAQ